MTTPPKLPNERSALSIDLALLPVGTSSFADVLARLGADDGLSPVRKRDMMSGVRRTASALGRPPEAVPACPSWLQPRLARVAPAGIGLSPKTWSNAVSDMRAALIHVGVTDRRHRRSHDLGPLWRPLWEALLRSKDRTLTKALGRFVHFLDRLEVTPDGVEDAHIDLFRDALTESEVRRSPIKAADNALLAWNCAVERIEGWPSVKLRREPRKRRVALPIETYPVSFAEDLARHEARLRAPDPFAEGPLQKPLRASSIATYHRELLRFAGVLVKAGTPPDEIVDLCALIRPDLAERGLRSILQANDNVVTPGISATAQALLSLARRLPDLPQAHLRAMERMASRLTQRKSKSMTTKTRSRLRPLQNPEVLRKLLLLPDRLFERSRGDARPAACRLREQAIAIALLCWAPVRRGNLASIHLERNVQRPGDGRAYLVFEPHEVKNSQRLEFELPRELIRMIDMHLASRSPHLCPRDTPWLFPRRDGAAPKGSDDLSRLVTRRLHRELGLEINLHLFRSLAVMIYLDAHPGAYEGARRLLGHSRASSTIAVYSGMEALAVSTQFGDLIARARGR